MRLRHCLSLFFAAAFFLTGCARQLIVSEVLQSPEQAPIYTCYNLWYTDPMNMDTLNMLKGEILPFGTEVVITSATDSEIRFTTVADRRDFRIRFSNDYRGRHLPAGRAAPAHPAPAHPRPGLGPPGRLDRKDRVDAGKVSAQGRHRGKGHDASRSRARVRPAVRFPHAVAQTRYMVLLDRISGRQTHHLHPGRRFVHPCPLTLSGVRI